MRRRDRRAFAAALRAPATVGEVLALPRWLPALRAFEQRAGRPYATLPLADQDSLTLQRLAQQVQILRLNARWRERLDAAGVSTVRTWDDWAAVPVTDKEAFADLFTGDRPGMVVPIDRGGFEVVASGGTSSGRPSETVYDLAELRDTYDLAGEFIGRHMLPANMGPERPRWLATTLADYQMWSSGTMVGGVLQMAPDVNYVGAGPMSADVFHLMMRYPGPKAIMGISQSIAYLTVLGQGLEARARASLRVAMYGSGALTARAQHDLVEMYPNTVVLSYFAATQAEAIGLQCDPLSPALATVPGLHHVEVLDAEGRMVAVGEEGELVVTRLLAHQAPVLRYKVGDRVRRLPDIVTPHLQTHAFEFIGRSGDFLHIGDTQYAARRALTAIYARLRDDVGVDVEAEALEVQFVNQRSSRELVLVVACADPNRLHERLASRLGSQGAAPYLAAALADSLSVFNSLEATTEAVERTGYFLGLKVVDPASPDLHRTEVGKVPLLIDRVGE